MAMSVVYSTLGGKVLAENRGGVIRQYLPDPLGNTAALADTTGTITDTYTYWPYGEVRTHIGTSTTPLTFLGTLGYFVDFVKQLYVRASHLRVDLTQWMTVDPVWPRMPPYAYVRRPNMVADFLGLAPDKALCDKQYEDCLAAATKQDDACIALVAASQAACLLLCSGLCLDPWTVALCGPCVAACLAAGALDLAACQAIFNFQKHQCWDQYLKCMGKWPKWHRVVVAR